MRAITVGLASLLLLGCLMVACATKPLTDGYPIELSYQEDEAGVCITSIAVSPVYRQIKCRHHLQWCGGALDNPPRVAWTVVDPRTDYTWEISHKSRAETGTDERPHFPDSFTFVDDSIQTAGENLPSILGKGDFTWTYAVRAIPDASLDCEPIKKDPQVVFKGGSGAGMLPPPWIKWSAIVVGTAAVVLLLIWIARRRAR